MKVDLYTQKGEKKGQVELKKEFFEVPYNEGLIHQALIRQQANARSPIAHTKIRREVRGGGRKPFRQKGTGSARQGSRRSPHFKGGGVVFGPRNTRNFEVDMPKKQRKKPGRSLKKPCPKEQTGLRSCFKRRTARHSGLR